MPLPRTFSPLRVKDYTVDIPGLQPNTPYVFTVRALNNRNGASSSAETRTTTPPQARCNGAPRPPMDVQTRSDSPTTLTVSWLAQANDPCVERYEVTYVAEAQTIAPRSLAPLYVTEKTVTLTNLQPDTTYNVVIAAVGTNGQRASVTTKGRTRPECSSSKAPLNTNARQVGPRAVQLTWNNPAPACVRNVQVTFVEKGSGSRGPVTNLGNKDNSFTFAQLQPGREYTFSVRYLYKDGKTGPASSAQLFLNNNSQGGVISVPGRR
jgi:chitodextrinase